MPESLAGYECGLKAIGASYTTATTESMPFCPLIIVPGFAGGEARGARKIRDLAYRGSTVLIESGALFDDPSEGEAHRRILRSHFSIDTKAPIALRDHREERSKANLATRKLLTLRESIDAPMSSLPYVDFVWPHLTKIRDFSRAVPVYSDDAQVVAVSPGGIPVAVRRRIGRGTMIFLGSPVGPSILAGDPEAREWLYGVVSQSYKASCLLGHPQ
ncbi:MAG: hypothetical protein ACRD2O_10000 [Terriglobia bacterium]